MYCSIKVSLVQDGLKVCTLIQDFGKYNTCLLEVGPQGPWKLHQGSGQYLLEVGTQGPWKLHQGLGQYLLEVGPQGPWKLHQVPENSGSYGNSTRDQVSAC